MDLVTDGWSRNCRIVSSLHEVKEDGNTVGNIRELAAALGVDY